MFAEDELHLECADGVVVATLRLEIDSANAGAVQAALAGGVPHDAHCLVLDLTPVDYLDSAGIHMLIQLNRRLRERRVRLRLVIASDSNLERLARIVALEKAVPVHPTRGSAVGRRETGWGNGNSGRGGGGQRGRSVDQARRQAPDRQAPHDDGEGEEHGGVPEIGHA